MALNPDGSQGSGSQCTPSESEVDSMTDVDDGADYVPGGVGSHSHMVLGALNWTLDKLFHAGGCVAAAVSSIIGLRTACGIRHSVGEREDHAREEADEEPGTPRVTWSVVLKGQALAVEFINRIIGCGEICITESVDRQIYYSLINSNELVLSLHGPQRYVSSLVVALHAGGDRQSFDDALLQLSGFVGLWPERIVVVVFPEPGVNPPDPEWRDGTAERLAALMNLLRPEHRGVINVVAPDIDLLSVHSDNTLTECMSIVGAAILRSLIDTANRRFRVPTMGGIGTNCQELVQVTAVRDACGRVVDRGESTPFIIRT